MALLASSKAHATTIDSQSCTVQGDNTMRFDGTVDLSGSDADPGGQGHFYREWPLSALGEF